MYNVLQDWSVLKSGKTWQIHFDVKLTRVDPGVVQSLTRQPSGNFMIISHSSKST